MPADDRHLSETKTLHLLVAIPICRDNLPMALASALSIVDAGGPPPLFHGTDTAILRLAERIMPLAPRPVEAESPAELRSAAGHGGPILAVRPGAMFLATPEAVAEAFASHPSHEANPAQHLPLALHPADGSPARVLAPAAPILAPPRDMGNATLVADLTGACTVMTHILVAEQDASIPVSLRTLTRAHLPFARLVERAQRAIHQADPDFHGVPFPPEWLCADHTFLVSDRHPMPLLRLPQQPLRLDPQWLAYVPDSASRGHLPARSDGGILVLDEEGAPVPRRADASDAARGLLAEGNAAQALALLDETLRGNRHDRRALLLLAQLLESLGEDEQLARILTYHLDSRPDDADALGMLNATRRRGMDRLLARCEIDNTGYLPRPFRVSVIVSTYASQAFMAECLADLEAQSIAAQTEIIVVDAASPEDERSVVAQFQKRHNNIRYIRTPERIGIYPAWNLAIHVSTGTYITPFSTNDRLAPDAHERLAATLDARPDSLLAFGDTLLTDEPHQSFANHSPSVRHGGAWRWPDYSFEYNLVSCTVGPHPMWRRQTHASHGFFDERFPALGDQEFFLRVGRSSRHVHIPHFTGLAWLSDSALSDESHTQQELLRIRHRYQCIHARDMVELSVLNTYVDDLLHLARKRGIPAAAALFARHAQRLADSPLVDDLRQLLQPKEPRESHGCPPR
ncbi:hypothetical protein GGQ74_002950 [Desulfobaculum xiamenense]|uniref:Glycosyltransferase 2-like domain-containing protein n=1 Tax=Desulfobaculum xiamenense TaxID=995050 RepID=A0A846QSA7_9BACT|nr:glycosyltransferase [Desulfobaculum xiamenense]NJB69253.1 hypothetical protein [Desulfobaculum xiamenense]